MKKFSQLAIPYIIWAALMLVLPMVLLCFCYCILSLFHSIRIFILFP